jgi:hypothetical protein
MFKASFGPPLFSERPSLHDLRHSPPSCGSHVPLPLDIVLRIASILHDRRSLRCLATLQILSKGTYDVVTPILYRHLHVTVCSGDLLDLDLDELPLDGEVALEASVRQLRETGEYWGTARRHRSIRRADAFRHARRITVHHEPSDKALDRVSSSQQSTSTRTSSSAGTRARLLFPHVDTVSLLPDAVDAIRTWSPKTYDRPRNPPLLELLAKTCSPQHLCLAFRLVESRDWEEHREATVSGQWQLVSRINRLHSDGWDRLESMTIHDIVHQVLPALEGCRNVYHFSPHVVRTSRDQSGRYRYAFPGGVDATGIQGPPWNIRSWQLSTAIKNLFPSGADAEAALKGTSWEFVGVEGHILTKRYRDDDDESGVEWGQVGHLVRDALRNALPLDLPAREGFAQELVDEVFTRIHYVDAEQAKPCESCSRQFASNLRVSRRLLTPPIGVGMQGAVVSPLEHTYVESIARSFEGLFRTPTIPLPVGAELAIPSMIHGLNPR